MSRGRLPDPDESDDENQENQVLDPEEERLSAMRLEVLREEVARLREQRQAQHKNAKELSRQLTQLFEQVMERPGEPTSPESDSCSCTCEGDEARCKCIIKDDSSPPAADRNEEPSSSSSGAAETRASAPEKVEGLKVEPQPSTSQQEGSTASTFNKSKAQKDFEWAKQQPAFQTQLAMLKEKLGSGVSNLELEIFAFVNVMECNHGSSENSSDAVGGIKVKLLGPDRHRSKPEAIGDSSSSRCMNGGTDQPGKMKRKAYRRCKCKEDPSTPDHSSPPRTQNERRPPTGKALRM